MAAMPSDQDQLPRLRCWLDGQGELHVAANRAGGRQLMEAVRRLQLAVEPLRIILALDTEPFPPQKNPVRFFGVERVFVSLQLERVDDVGQVEYLQIRRRGTARVVIRLGKFFVGEFYDASCDMAAGHGDFCVGPPDRVARKQRRPGQIPAYVWFWGNRTW